LVALAGLIAALLRGRVSPRVLLTDHLPAIAAVAATLFHVGYYLIRVGADHFEYRVLSHIVPLGTLATAAMAARIRRGPWLPTGTMVLLGVASSVAWVHLAVTPPRAYPDYSAFGDHLPAWLRPFVREFDRRSAWLQMHFCFRTGELVIWVERQRQVLPARARMQTDPNDIPIVKTIAVGYVGWVLPDIAVLDELGLNDWVAARTPTTEWYLPFLPRAVLEQAIDRADLDHDGVLTRAELQNTFAAISGGASEVARGFVDRLFLLFAGDLDDGLSPREVADMRRFFAELRFIAHERRAPGEYVAALDPNVTIVDRAVVVRPRTRPLTAERLRGIEAEWRQRLGAAQRPR
jgi:hypothetical protein